MNDIESLEQKIKYYAQKYYEGNPEISDSQFDYLVEQLKSLKPDSYVINHTGWGFETQGNKVKHKYSHISSLDKAKTFDDIPDRFKNTKIYVSPKLDGLSAVAYYYKGKLIQGITRGNGEFGKDITSKLKFILGDKIKDTEFTGAVRGELIINKDVWSKMKEEDDTLIAPRNVASGIIGRNDNTDIDKLDLVVYKVVGYENNSNSLVNNMYDLSKREDMLLWLSRNFKHCIPIYYFECLTEPIWNMYNEKIFDTFCNLGYELDGLVLSKDTSVYNTSTNGYMYDEIAYKFSSESCETEVIDIEWTMSRTQRYVPVAIVKPVQLAGAVINRVTCNNAKMVSDLGIGKGATVEITRSNEVIPYILGVTNPVFNELPKFCPYCNSILSWSGVDLKCDNTNCSNIELSNLQQWCEILGETDGLAWTLMKQYLDLYDIKSISELYEKQEYILTDLSSRQLSITEQKIKQFFEALFMQPVSIYSALLSLNIPRLGEKTCKQLSYNTNLCIDLYENSIKYINKLNVSDNFKTELTKLVKDATSESILNNLEKVANLKSIWNRIVFNNKDKNSSITYVAVTGSLNTMKRDAFEKYISDFGYELSSNLKKCKYLITNNLSSTSTKMKQAKENGVAVISEEDFLNICKNS